ncbi:hypothetical protein FHU10_2276 [Serratia fonticola]|uniref:Uncharacterized protein n=1 Tax=Serratia fonticola TaxID=47917 RepID=A0A542CWP6_SERFO|nr:hypothetical protein FHU09_0176 [Serratia fonticola]TQI95248.1 hypothetical protein FHU11_0617 [Serratia fonticola]TVZ69745.1 hypothetical protein FHU10_2276 [Serratia fonticola]
MLKPFLRRGKDSVKFYPASFKPKRCDLHLQQFEIQLGK